MRSLRGAAVGVGMLAVVSALACKKTAPTQKTATSQKAIPSNLSGGLAGELTEAKDFRSAVQAAHRAMAKGGISVVEGDRVVVNSQGPPSTASFSPDETYALAAEARHRASMGRMTLEELGNMLSDLGWPFPGGPLPGEQLVDFLKEWVTEARKDPRNPENFTPLFLADMAQRQVPAVDLTKGEYRPEQLRLSLLELHLIAAAFDRALTPKVSGAWLPGWLRPAVAHAQGDPCTQFKEGVSKAYGSVTKAGTEAGSVVISELVSAGLQKAIDAVGISGDTFSDAMSALGIAAKLWKLVALYSNVQAEVTIESDNPLHKPLKGEPNKYTAYTVRAGVNDKEWAEFQQTWQSANVARAGYDCLAALGIPVPADKGDIGKEAGSWRVEWRLLPEKGLEEHAYISREHNPGFEKRAGGALGQLQMNLQASGDHSATSTLVVDILPEKHEHKGIEKSVDVTAKATLETSAPPGLGTIVNAFKGGWTPTAVAGVPTPGVGYIIALTDALVEVCAGWFQEIAEPEAYATLTVTYHEPGIKLHIVDVNRVKLDFSGQQKPFGFIGGKGAETSHHVYDGGIQLGKDSAWHGQVRVAVKGAYTIGDTLEAQRRGARINPGEDASFEDAIKAFTKGMELLADLPTCKGTYEGTQTLAVEGKSASDDTGKPKVQLAFIPVGPPESYRTTPRCPWSKDEIDGIETLPLRIPMGEERVLVIDPPKPGEVRTYRESVNIPDVFASTVTTVGP